MNKYLEKIADTLKKAKDTPKEQGDSAHALRALDKLDKSKGLVVHHSTGSGKTKLFLRAVERVHQKDPSAKAMIVAPASLVTNIDKEIAKHKITGINRENLEVMSYQKALFDAKRLSKQKYAIAIADEAHNFRNPDAKRTKILKKIFQDSDKRLLATATGNYNQLSDLSSVMNMAAGYDILPENSHAMNDRYTQKRYKSQSLIEKITGAEPVEVNELKNQHELANVFEDYVDYYDSNEDPEAQKHFPKVEEEIVETEMSPEQAKYYKFAEGKIPWLTRMKIRSNLPLDKKEKSSLNSFSTGVRQVSNGYRNLVSDGDVAYSPKIQEAVKRLEGHMKKDKNFRGLVYSNYLDSGVGEYSKLLTEKGIKHSVYDGTLSRPQKDQLVKDYNEGKNNVLLLSSAGAEGLDTKGTKLTQVLEPHFNPSKIKQVIGRGRRFNSHEHLPEKERVMKVEHYLTTSRKPMFGKTPYSIDKYLSENSDTKQKLFDQVKDVMRKYAQ